MTSQTATSERSLTVPWWLVLIEGIAAIIVGIFLFARPAATTLLLVQFLGFYWLVSGIFTLVSIFWDRSVWGWKLFSGILGIIAGILIIRNPLWSTLLVPTTLAMVLGFTGIFIGIGQLVHAFKGGGWGMGVLGVLSIVLGILLLSRPVIAGLALPFVLAFMLVAGGILAIFAAFGLRSARKKAPPVVAEPAVRSAAVELPAAPAVAAEAVEAAAPAAAVSAAAAAEELVESAPAVEAAVEPVEAVPVLAEEAGQTVEAVAEAAGTAGETLDVAAAGAAAGVASAVAGMDEGAVEEVETMTPAVAEMEQKLAETEELPTAVEATLEQPAQAVEAATEDLAEKVTDADITGNFDPSDLDDIAKFKNALEYIEGIGPAYAEKLKAIGLVTCLDLLKAGASRKGREMVVEKSGISSKLILKWVNHLDLYRIKGVGSEYADLLEAAGVDTVVELAQRNPSNLITRMLEVNEEKNLVRKPPTSTQVEEWVSQAKGLSRLITY